MRVLKSGVGAALAASFLSLLASVSTAEPRQDYLAGVAAKDARAWPDAAQDFMKVTAQLPGYAPAWKQLAVSRYYLGDYEGAVASADHYLTLAPGDSSFAAWDDGLHTQLKLPPRSVPTVAVPTPTPVVAGLLQAAPPPGADAEAALAPGPAAQASAPAPAPAVAPALPDASPAPAVPEAAPSTLAPQADVQPGIQAPLPATAQPAGQTPTPAQAQPQAAPQPTAQPQSPAPADAARTGWGLRVLGGYAFGLGSFTNSEQVDSATGPSGKGYNAAPAGGLSGAVELLYDWGPHLECSLGLYPLSWDLLESSGATSSVNRNNNSEATALFLPVLLGLGWRQPLGKDVDFVASIAGGVIPGAKVTVTSTTTQTTASNLLTSTDTVTSDYAPAPAWRAWIGGEWRTSPLLSLDLGLQALGAGFSSALGSVQDSTVDQSGNGGYASVAQPPRGEALNLLSVSLLGGATWRF